MILLAESATPLHGTSLPNLRAPSVKLIAWTTLAAMLAGMLVLIGSPHFRWPGVHSHSPFGADLLQEWVAGEFVTHGRASAIYLTGEFAAAQHDVAKLGFTWDANYFFRGVYPPAYYLWMSPLSWLSYPIAVFAWAFSMIGLFVAASYLCRQCIAPRMAERSTYNSSLFLWPALAFYPAILASLTMGQKGILWMFLTSAVVLAWNRKRPLLAGLIFGLFSLKPTLFFLLPLMMLRSRHYAFVIGATLMAAFLYGVAFLTLPRDTWLSFLDVVAHSSSYHLQAGYELSWCCNLLSYSGLLNQIGIAPYRWLVLGPVFVAVIGRCLLRPIDLSNPTDLALGLLGTMLLSPHFYHYDVAILLVPLYLIESQSTGRGWFMVAALWLALAVSGLVFSACGLGILPVTLLAGFVWLSVQSPNIWDKCSTMAHRYPTVVGKL